jgi:putative iron-dependent peroxidase
MRSASRIARPLLASIVAGHIGSQVRMSGATSQPGILAAPPLVARSVAFRMAPGADAKAALARLRDRFDVSRGVAALGTSLARAAGVEIPGLRVFPALAGAGVDVPSTQAAAWFLLRGDERGALFDATERVAALLGAGFVLDDALDLFVYAGGRDLTGYEDGTENPKGDAAAEAALVATGVGTDGVAGSSFVAVQRWVHDLVAFRERNAAERDSIIGRRRDTNDEIADAPASAHVKRSAQESFEPPAFMLRRSMPWADAHAQGLEFIAFGESLDRFERVLSRMLGLDDGVTDALFSFSRPVRGGYYWCPPVAHGRLDLSRLGV